jgi:hypothetical protein
LVPKPVIIIFYGHSPMLIRFRSYYVFSSESFMLIII